MAKLDSNSTSAVYIVAGSFMVNYLSSLCVTFLMHKIGITPQSCSKIKCDNASKVLRAVCSAHLNSFVYLWRLIRTWYYLFHPREFSDPVWCLYFALTTRGLFLWCAPPMPCMLLKYYPHCSRYWSSNDPWGCMLSLLPFSYCQSKSMVPELTKFILPKPIADFVRSANTEIILLDILEHSLSQHWAKMLPSKYMLIIKLC